MAMLSTRLKDGWLVGWRVRGGQSRDEWTLLKCLFTYLPSSRISNGSFGVTSFLRGVLELHTMVYVGYYDRVRWIESLTVGKKINSVICSHDEVVKRLFQ